MRVIHLIGGGDTGGAKTHVLNLLRELDRHIDVGLFCFRRGEFSEDAERMGIPIQVIETGDPLRGMRALKKLIGGQKVDIVHCHGARGNLMGNLIRRAVKAPVVTTVHSDYKLDYLGRPMARLVYGSTNVVALRNMDYYIGVADSLTDILIERNFPAGRTYTLYNGIDFSSPLPCKPRQEFLRSLGMQVRQDDVIAGIAARLTPVKDYPTLLKAMRLACEQNPHLKLVAAGDGEDREKLQAMTRELGLAGQVCFAGWVQDMNSFYNAIDINLLTSLTEGSPYVLTEGARMKRATIASNVGGVPMLIDDGYSGLIFDPGNEQHLARHLLTLANDRELRDAMGQRIYEKAKADFSIDRMVEHQLEIYRSILQREARRRENKRDGVVICGAYGHGNAGDDAILRSIIRSVRKLDETIPVTVLAKNTESVKKKYRTDSIYTLNVPQVLLALRKSRLYINGGGTLIQNATSQRSLRYYLFTLQAAKLLGNKVDMYGCGIGPVTGKNHVKKAARVLDRCVDRITLREADSLEKLREYGVTKPMQTLSSDPALALHPASEVDALSYLRRHRLNPEGKYLCFILRTWYGFSEKAEAIAQCAQRAYREHGLTPVFLSLNNLYDGRAAQQVIPHLSCPWVLLDDGAEPELLIAVLSYMQAVVSMRLHGLILSSMSGLPLVGVSYDPKIGYFLNYLGTGSCIELRDVTQESLSAAIDQAVTLIPRREELKAKADRLIAVEGRNAQAVKELLAL